MACLSRKRLEKPMADLIEHDDMGLLNALPTLQRDAARYRWLKNQLLAADFDWQGECVLVFKWPREIPVGGNLDKIVDAAISAAPGVSVVHDQPSVPPPTHGSTE